MNKPNEYVLSVGETAKGRLQLLDEIYGPYSYDYLKSLDLSQVNTVLDVGCGSGNMSCWLAQQLGPAVQVVGVDVSKEQLAIAEQQAHDLKLDNVHFQQCSIYDLPQLHQQFDLVYCRYVLIHLSEPVKAIQQMLAVTNKAGILVCEEQSLLSSFTYPRHTSFTRVIKMIQDLAQVKNIDYDYGIQLHQQFQQLGLSIIDMKISQPVLISHEHKRLWPWFLEESRQGFLDSGVIDETSYDQLVTDLNHIANDEQYYIASMSLFHVSARIA